MMTKKSEPVLESNFDVIVIPKSEWKPVVSLLENLGVTILDMTEKGFSCCVTKSQYKKLTEERNLNIIVSDDTVVK